MSSSPMLIITFILLPAIAARPVTDGFFSNLTNHIGLRDDGSEAGSTYAMYALKCFTLECSSFG